MKEIPKVQSLPQAVFFDFDGVILESAEVKTEAFLELFKQYPEVQAAIKQHHLQNQGVSRYKKFEWIYSQLLHLPFTKNDSERLGNQFSDLVFNKVVQSPFVAGAEELLKAISNKCLCFVASGTPEDELQRIVSQRNLTSYFKEVCGTPRTKIEIVLEMIAKYNLIPSHCCFIGDATTDYEAAKETGLNFIARNTEVMNAYWQLQKNIKVVNSLAEVNDEWVNRH
jgi:beta-phosphoglucomutase-like phosphatase (HAD superfamily)